MAVPTQVHPTVLTAAGRRDLRQRLDRTLEALADLADRMSAGERGADEVAEHQQLLHEVEHLTTVLDRSRDVGSVEEDPSIVEIGDEVVVGLPDGEVDTYALVHPAEAKVAQGRVSVASPLGRALLGARPGETVTVDAPAGAYTCTIRARRRLS